VVVEGFTGVGAIGKGKRVSDVRSRGAVGGCRGVRCWF
jgi:hypothetical protein